MAAVNDGATLHTSHIVWLLLLLLATVTTSSADLVSDLRGHGFTGPVYLPHTSGYERFRRVQNAACNILKPLVVVRPLTPRDVAVGLQVAQSHYLPVSVRSGGHGYTCNNIKNGSLHFDMRRMNKVQLVHEYGAKHPPRLVRLGPGSTWSRVLKIVPPSQYTMVHGQCTDVGVGGYLLGGGVNVAGSTTRYGLGSENVVEYEMVTADGEIVVVNKDRVTKKTYDGYEITSVPSRDENDLFFALKGAGSNYGIVTEFLYKVYPHPETKPVVLFVFFRSIKDFYRLKRLSDRGRYQIAAYRIQHFRKLDNSLDNFVNVGLENVVGTLRRIRRSKLEPMIVMLTDMHTHGPTTPLGPVIKAVRHAGLDNALPRTLGISHSLTSLLGLDEYDPNWKNYDALYLSKAERMKLGKQAFTATTIMSATTPKFFEGVAFKHPIFGLSGDISSPNIDIGCDACNWFFTIWSNAIRPVRFFANDRSKEGTKGSRIAFEFTCDYDPHNSYRAKRCKAQVDQIRTMINRVSVDLGEPIHQYYNTPSCHLLPYERSFPDKYFGSSYGQLLQIKRTWDPRNVFNFCQSIGSTDEDCCIT